MDFFAGLFGLTMFTVSVLVAYHYGIKPDREEKKRRAEQELEEMRRKRGEVVRKRPVRPA